MRGIRQHPDDASNAQIIMIQYWFEELRRLVPTN